jgi:D-lactate dehydrogenase
MKALVFSTRSYSRTALNSENASGRHHLKFLETKLEAATASLCAGYGAALVFVNDKVDRSCLKILAEGGTRLVATLSTGTNHIDLPAAKELGITVASVPSYSPNAVSEFTLALLLAMARKIPRANQRVR